MRTMDRMTSLLRGMLVCALIVTTAVGAHAQRGGGATDRWGGWGGVVEPALRATLRPMDGAAIRGEIVSWTGEDVTIRDQGGAESLLRWDELDARQVYETTRRLIDTDNAGDWLRVGVLMLTLGEDGSGGFAERSFAVAARLDAATALVADAARRAHAAGGDPVKTLSATPESLNTAPDRSGANADEGPWPELSEAQRAVETARVRARAEAMVRGAGLALSQTDAGEFILFTDLDEKATKEAAAQLERMYRALVRTLELPAETRLFQGKAVVFLLTKRDEFVHLEREAFGVDPNGAIGMCHLRDADVFVVCHKAEDETAYMSTLIHETVHGFMYRYKSPAELPIWANEGLADYIAGFLLTNSLEPGRHWTQAKAFVRSGEDASDVLYQSYEDGTWPEKDSYAVSHMLVRHMLRRDARAMKQWIDDIKDGLDWRGSLRERFALTPNQLADDFAAAMTRESYYKR